MTAVLLTVFNFFVALAGPIGTIIAPSQIVAVIDSPVKVRDQARDRP
jgi:hypothetical protein